MFSIIAAIGKNRELGKEGKLLFRIPEDLKFFKNTTTGHKILMGRKTWDSLPQKLPNRTNIVVTHTQSPLIKKVGDKPAQRPDLIISDLKAYTTENIDSDEEIFIIGGGMLYWEMLRYCQKLYLTEVHSSADADTFFPEFDKSLYTQKIIKEGTDHGLNYTISCYILN